ncbi:hypothetical protein HUJ04_006682 [Dendroctonus ponderosae]|nr:hypothetical protein HUJ04_006682 [Dendroctonus ponderosae]
MTSTTKSGKLSQERDIMYYSDYVFEPSSRRRKYRVIQKDRLKKHWTILLSVSALDDVTGSLSAIGQTKKGKVRSEELPEVTEEEVVEALKNMKRSKARGEDDITN